MDSTHTIRRAGSTRRTAPSLSRILAAALLTALVSSACSGIRGSGEVTSESRDVKPFSEVEANAGVNVEVTVGTETQVTVHYDDNLLNKVTTEVRGDRLAIGLDGSIATFGGPRRFIEVGTPRLAVVESTSGASVSVFGSTDTITVIASSGASIDLSDLEARSVEVDASSGASVVIQASSQVTGEASGGADVTILGEPETVDVATSGGADIHR